MEHNFYRAESFTMPTFASLKRLSILASSVLLISLLALTMGGCNRGASPDTQGSKGAAGVPAVPVGVAPAAKQDMPVFLEGLGNVTAFNTVNIKSRVDGQITQIAFREGQDVKQGELLVQIDPRPYQVALEQAKATLYRDQTQLTIAKRQFDRYTQLFKEGVVSREQLDQQDSIAGALDGTVRADQANVDNQQLQITYCRITAPVSGRVGLRLVDTGNMIHASDLNPMLVITQLQPITVLFTLPEDSLRSIREKMDRGALGVDVYNRDDQTRLSSGKLLTIDNQIDSTTGTVRLKAVFSNDDRQLWPNQFVNVRLLLDTRKDAVVIPTAAAVATSLLMVAILLVGAGRLTSSCRSRRCRRWTTRPSRW
jgi:multidrug efflux system membrane fusion protein